MDRKPVVVETWARLVAKTVEWRLTGVILGTLLGYGLTDSWTLGVLFGGLYNIIRLAVMPLRDRIWNRISWGLTFNPPPDGPGSPR